MINTNKKEIYAKDLRLSIETLKNPSEFKPTERNILLHIAFCYKLDGSEVTLSSKKLSEECGVSVPTITRHLDYLRRKGVIFSQVKKGNDKRLRNHFRFTENFINKLSTDLYTRKPISEHNKHILLDNKSIKEIDSYAHIYPQKANQMLNMSNVPAQSGQYTCSIRALKMSNMSNVPAQYDHFYNEDTIINNKNIKNINKQIPALPDGILRDPASLASMSESMIFQSIGKELTEEQQRHIRNVLDCYKKHKQHAAINPVQLFNQVKFSILNKKNKTFTHALNTCMKIIRDGNWKTPKGYCTYDENGKVDKEIMDKQEAAHKDRVATAKRSGIMRASDFLG